MGFLKKAIIISTPFIGFYYFKKRMAYKYPSVPLESLPQEMLYQRHLYLNNDTTYFPLINCYKTTITAPASTTPTSVIERFLKLPYISRLLSSKTNKMGGMELQSNLLETVETEQYSSAIIKWNIKEGFCDVSNNKVERWSWPYKMMKGAVNEFFVVERKNSDGDLAGDGSAHRKKFDVYLLSALECDRALDRKNVPSGFDGNMARMLLYRATN